MSNEITIQTLGDTVRDRVKKAIFDSIPDEAVGKLIESEFFRLTTNSEWMTVDNKNLQISPLQRIIIDELRKQMSARMQADVTKYLDLTYKNQSKELVEKSIKELAPLFMAGMMESFAEAAVSSLRNQLSVKGIYV